jgi:DNA-binding transcriptional ArsR family regulator
MVSPHRLAELAGALADPTRATIVSALFDGTSRPAGELAALGGVSASTASAHLARLLQLGLIAVEPRGRHRYFRLGSPAVAEAIEALGCVLPPVEVQHTPAQRQIRELRVCYDHLAGRLAVALREALLATGWVHDGPEGTGITDEGFRGLRALGLGERLEHARGGRPLVKTCLDWTERRDHFSGLLGAALAAHFLEGGWAKRVLGSRALVLTAKGSAALPRLGLPRG